MRVTAIFSCRYADKPHISAAFSACKEVHLCQIMPGGAKRKSLPHVWQNRRPVTTKRRKIRRHKDETEICGIRREKATGKKTSRTARNSEIKAREVSSFSPLGEHPVAFLSLIILRKIPPCRQLLRNEGIFLCEF